MKNTARFLVVMHIYYTDQIDLMVDCLKNIPDDYDLYVTLLKKDKIITDKIKKQKPDAKFVMTENVGYDIWPFIKVINSVDLSKYSYVIKLHTKRDMPKDLPCPLGNGFFVRQGSGWRDDLLSFIKTKSNLQKCLKSLKKSKVGMCTRYNLIHGMANHCGVIDEAKRSYPNYVFGLKDFCFVAGTMFVSKIKPIQMVKDMNITAGLFDKPTADHKIQFAHVVERTIGEAVYKSGMKIVDPFTAPEHIKNMNKKYNKLKYIRRFINYIFFFVPFPKIRRRLKDKFFVRMYLKRLLKIIDLDSNY